MEPAYTSDAIVNERLSREKQRGYPDKGSSGTLRRNDGPEQEREANVVQNRIGALAEAQSGLHKRLLELRENLHPVLRPSYPEPAIANERSGKQESASSPLCDMLEDRIMHTLQQTAMIEDILSRLDL